MPFGRHGRQKFTPNWVPNVRKVGQDLDQLGSSGNVSANRCKRLAERAPAMLSQSPAARAEHSGAVSIVDHQPGAILLLDLGDARQTGHVFLCRIESLDDDEAVPELRALFAQKSLKLIQLIVVKRTSRRARQSYANHGTVVHEFIMNDQITVGHHRPDGGYVSCMSANEYH